MERRIEQDVDGWPTRPFDDGYDGLRQLASADFSGVVRAGGAWLFFVNGKIVGVFEGDLDDVEGSQGTAHKAPHPSLPLLYAMQATGGDTRAKYYTNDTSIAEVDDTLSSGSFTGYVELSENVLSGDYYQLYHGGNSMSVAFVGNSGKMVTGEEAFERADDEVGIYEVVDVDVDVVDVPEPEPEDAAGGAAGAGAAGTDDAASDPGTDAEETDAGDESDDERSEATTRDRSDETTPEDGADEATQDEAASDEAATGDPPESSEDATTTPAPPVTSDDAARSNAAAASAGDDATANDSDDDDTGTSGSTASTGTAAERSSSRQRDRERAASASDSAAADAPSDGSASDESASDDATSAAPSTTDGAGSTAVAPESSETDAVPRESEAAWRDATTVPSLDPDHSEEAEPAAQAEGQTPGQTHGERRRRDARSGQQAGAQSRTQSRGQSRSASEQRQSAGEQSQQGRPEDVDETLEQEVLEREDRIDRLQQRVENLEGERDDVAEERDQLQDRVDSLTEENESLRGEIRELEQEVEELESTAANAAASGGASGGDRSGGEMAPRAALEATDLFVRYDSKSAPTLAAAHDGDADATAVNENLRLDVHTQFEDEGATVDGEPFEAFLRETMAYRFVEWLVRTLPYEIRETDSAGALRDLYDALPEVDRVEFHGEVTREAVEDEEGAPSETFDVVVRDKMGEALLVANMNEARDPATGRMIVDLQEGASRVKEDSAALAGAFFVTRSFFEPAALETASEATSGSLLSRDSRASYVKISRKQGYHLCLVEARGDDLHLNVPEL